MTDFLRATCYPVLCTISFALVILRAMRSKKNYSPEPFSGCLSAIFLFVTGSVAAAIVLIIMWVLS